MKGGFNEEFTHAQNKAPRQAVWSNEVAGQEP